MGEYDLMVKCSDEYCHALNDSSDDKLSHREIDLVIKAYTNGWVCHALFADENYYKLIEKLGWTKYLTK